MLSDIYTKCFKQVFVFACILSYLNTFYTLTVIYNFSNSCWDYIYPGKICHPF